MARFGILVFPGSNCEMDVYRALREVMDQPCEYVWYRERDLSRYAALILPGGFSYGDYLRPGAIAALAPAMDGVREAAARGQLVMGICNGFQILCEAGLLPGALQRNVGLQFRCVWTHLRVENAATPFTGQCRPGQVLKIPINHGEGNYFADPETLAALNDSGRIVFRYCTPAGEVTPTAAPNGSIENIAGIINARGNVLGMMPHPERAAEAILGSEDGKYILNSMVRYLTGGRALHAG